MKEPNNQKEPKAAKLTILEKLLFIQQNLRAPKDKWNSFGKYHFRSAESIIESAKPLLKAQNCVLVFNCHAEEMSGHARLTMNIKLVDVESGESVETSTSVREDDQRAGMCASQNSGSTESFAKKYALGDLFAIDDSKDDDCDEMSPKNPKNVQQAVASVAPAQTAKAAVTVEKSNPAICPCGSVKGKAWADIETDVLRKILALPEAKVKDLTADHRNAIIAELAKREASK